jgi:hypothetical protein
MIYKYVIKKNCDDKLKKIFLKGRDDGTTEQAFPFKRKLYFHSVAFIVYILMINATILTTNHYMIKQ